jgi:capsid protein
MIWMIAANLIAACSIIDATPSGLVDDRGYAARVASELSDVGTSTYDALNPKGRRKAASSATMSEDKHLPDSQRRKLIGGVRELRRNSSILDWMIRRHLDYVATHTFQATTGDDAWDDPLEAWMREESEADRCEVRGIFSLPLFVRTAEAMAILDGDLGVMLVDQDSGRVQGIEADRIKDLTGATSEPAKSGTWYNGVRIDGSGRPIEYAVHARQAGGSGLVFERLVPARNLHLHGYLTRFDQYRGVSPVVSAYNQLRDIYEAETLALVQTKVAGLFGLKVTRNADLAMGTVTGGTDDEGNEDRSSYSVDFGAGPVFLDMDPGDDAAFLTNNNPGPSTQEFWRFVTHIALLAVDLPYALFDSSAGNFFGNKTAWLAYDRACDEKRDRVQALLNKITAFKLAVAIRSGRLPPPRNLAPGQRPWAWVPRKMPWWRPLEEVTANLKAIEGGLTTPQRVCAESDQGDWYENVDEIAKVGQAVARTKVRREHFADFLKA